MIKCEFSKPKYELFVLFDLKIIPMYPGSLMFKSELLMP